MTYIKDLVAVPDHVGHGDFVLRILDGPQAGQSVSLGHRGIGEFRQPTEASR